MTDAKWNAANLASLYWNEMSSRGLWGTGEASPLGREMLDFMTREGETFFAQAQADARRAALEEAAKVADLYAQWTPGVTHAELTRCETVAAEIRALLDDAGRVK